MEKLTKIVATISDRKCEPEFIEEMYAHGMDVVRINTAHQTTVHSKNHRGPRACREQQDTHHGGHQRAGNTYQ